MQAGTIAGDWLVVLYFSHQASTKRKKEKERYAAIIDKLKDEEKKQVEHCQRIEARLKKECETWFTARKSALGRLHRFNGWYSRRVTNCSQWLTLEF